ncbi:membrane protein insertase YidC [Hymenobacter sp. H14-R3]|uniref:membrane protein insertase YidC n=1 Tax=Hymenobacter sp. H14-R3 TaxID=3046308 RepID=UPI0024BAF0B8|nr:membrane protein insertase YidC [Hymenobacter sp. H14-R3]MDJ0366387.1 membrane protein insertase YidC [Hymenobacter sp. H14-R3]
MDRNQATGLFLISALLLVYLFFFSPKAEPDKNKAQATTTTAAKTPVAAAPSPGLPPVVVLDSAAGPVRSIELKNPELTLTFSTQGGRVAAVRLNNYKTFFGKPLDLFDAQSARYNTTFTTTGGQKVDFAGLNFQASAPVATADGGQQLAFVAPVGGGTITQTYTVPKTGYEVKYNLKLAGVAVSADPLKLSFVDNVRQTEQDLKQNRNHTTINHYQAAGNHDALAEASEKPEEVTVAVPLLWAADKHDFFVAGLVADSQPFTSGQFNATVNLADSTYIKTLSTTLGLPVADVTSAAGGQYRFFFGPNQFSLLKSVAPDFDRNVYLGWGLFRWVNRFVVLPVFTFLEQYISSYGIIILLLVVLIKLVTWPLTYKTYESQARMKVLKPEIDEIKAKHPDDAAKTQQETMKLYTQFGVSPLSGCVPTLLTLPILFAMFQFFPNAIELRQQPFLWASDLSTFDSPIHLPFTLPYLGSHISLFTVLMTISTLFMTYQSNQMNAAAMQGPMKFYSYLMPLVFFFVLNSFAAGLTWYYLVSNVVTLGQQALTRSFVNDTKIRAQLEANKVKNKDKKPGGFQARLAEAMKTAQEREAQAKKPGKA